MLLVSRMGDITNSQQFRQRSTTDDVDYANPLKRKWSNFFGPVSGEINSLRQENNPYLSVYPRLESSPVQSFSILPSSSSPLLPANLPVNLLAV